MGDAIMSLYRLDNKEGAHKNIKTPFKINKKVI